MPKITMTLTDVLDGEGRPICRTNIKIDREGYPLDAAPTRAMLLAAGLRILLDLGVLERMMPLIEDKIQLDELTGYLRKIGALDDQNNLHITPIQRPANVIDVEATEVPVDAPAP